MLNLPTPAGRAMLAGAWTPAKLPGLVSWWRAGPRWCFSDSGANTPCAAGDLVYVWKDQSGNSHDLTQSTSGLRPTLVNVGGLWFVRGNGAGIRMTTAANWPQIVQPFTVGLVLNNYTTATGALDRILWRTSHGGYPLAYRNRSVNSGATWSQYAGTAVSNNGSYVSNGNAVRIDLFNGASSIIRSNATETTTNPSTNELTATNDVLVVFNDSGGADSCGADIADMVVTSNAMSPADRDRYATYGYRVGGIAP